MVEGLQGEARAVAKVYIKEAGAEALETGVFSSCGKKKSGEESKEVSSFHREGTG